MGAAKPTLGYPSRTKAVQGLRAKGHDTRGIAQLIGITASSVTALEASAGRSFARSGLDTYGVGNRTVLFPIDVLEKMLPAAKVRGIGPNELARRIVEAVVDDDIIDAVLDDHEVRGVSGTGKDRNAE